MFANRTGCQDLHMYLPLDKSVQLKYFSYILTKTYVVGTKKNRLNETVLLSSQNKCYNSRIRKYSEFYAHILFTCTYGILCKW